MTQPNDPYSMGFNDGFAEAMKALERCHAQAL